MATSYFEPPLLQYQKFEEPLVLESGEVLNSYTIAYEAYGELSEACDNVILIAHSFTAHTHVTRAYPGDSKPGWWEMLVGPGRAIDTRKYYVICANLLGGCNGSTGPASINPATGVEYGMSFPNVTVKDIVVAQKRLLDRLGIKHLHAIAGGSMGGMQALLWAVLYPSSVGRIIACSCSARWSPFAVTMDGIARHAIMADSNWNNGNYYGGNPPISGMKIARMIAESTFFTQKKWHNLFDKKHQIERVLGFGTNKPLQIERFLEKQVEGFSYKFDPNSYLYLSRALDQFDLMLGFPSLQAALSKCKAKVLLTSDITDGLCPRSHIEELADAFSMNNIDITLFNYETDSGHDSFLTEQLELSEIFNKILSS